MQIVLQAPAGSFGSAIYVPTPEGFTDAPGCVESYAATATFRLYTKGDKADGDGVTRPLVLREEVEFKVRGAIPKQGLHTTMVCLSVILVYTVVGGCLVNTD